MNIRINKSEPHGAITVPSSKSHLHRLLIISAFSEVNTEILNFSKCEDIDATINCLSILGAQFFYGDNSVTVRGIRPDCIHSNVVLDCKDSGSTLRMLLPVVLLNCKDVTFTGSNRLFQRSIPDIEIFLTSVGVMYNLGETYLAVSGKINNGKYSIDCSVTSQLYSGLCIALSLIEGHSVIESDNVIVSRPYIDLTVFQLKSFGAKIEFNNNTVVVDNKIEDKNRCFIAEGDWSCAANFFLLAEYGNVTINGLNAESFQPDSQCIVLIRKLIGNYYKIDLCNIPDLAPILFVVAALNHGAEFYGVSRLKFKECDRLNSMLSELYKCGVTATIKDDSVIIRSGTLHSPKEPFETYNDHRIAMSLAVLATQVGAQINNIECVAKSSPNYFTLMKKLSVDIVKL